MADKDMGIEQAAIGSLYKKQQARQMAVYTQVGDKYAKGVKQGVQEGGATAYEGLERQASLLQDANTALSQIEQGERYDSEASFAAAQERGIRKKMKALNMLDQASEEVVYDPMVAEFIDPVTGERVDSESFDYASDRALQNSMRNDIREAQRSAGIDDDIRTATAIANLKDKNDPRATGYFESVFGKNAADMQKTWSEGRLDMFSVASELTNVRNNAYRAGNEQLKDIHKTEYESRQAGSLANASAYNTQQSYAQQKGAEQSSEAADAKTKIRQSINEDQQNLARRSAGATGGGKRKARIDYGGSSDSSRPV